MHNSDFMAGQRNVIRLLDGEIGYVCTHSYSVSIKTSLTYILLYYYIVGQIESF